MERATCYIARKEELSKALFDKGELRVIAVYPNGTIKPTSLIGMVVKLFGGPETFQVTTDSMLSMRGDRSVTVHII